MTRLQTALQARYRRWLRRRLPPARSITLEQRRLFIFPSRSGFFFMFALLVMLVTAVNYQNNLAYALTFWLAMLFVVGIHFTHANLMRLTVTAVRAEPVYPGQRSEFTLRLSCAGRRGHYAVRLQWPESDTVVDVPGHEAVEVRLYQTVGGRGWFTPPRLRIESTYPLGLLTCWSFAHLDIHALVWPKPHSVGRPVFENDTSGAVGFSNQSGIDDLAGFRDYHPGDAPRLIDWRSHARDLPLQTKLFSAPVREDHWLDWRDFPEGNVEQRLSWLCFLALQHDARGEEYGLRLPGQEIPMASGNRQRDLVLRALALFDREADVTA